jgi:hypothetical protein
VSDHAATDGLCGIAIEITAGDQGDPEVAFDVVDEDFFYDPRSKRLDFSDARFQGVGKWLDADLARRCSPTRPTRSKPRSKAAPSSPRTPTPTTSGSADGDVKRIRLVDIWYKHKGEWCY